MNLDRHITPLPRASDPISAPILRVTASRSRCCGESEVNIYFDESLRISAPIKHVYDGRGYWIEGLTIMTDLVIRRQAELERFGIYVDEISDRIWWDGIPRECDRFPRQIDNTPSREYLINKHLEACENALVEEETEDEFQSERAG